MQLVHRKIPREFLEMLPEGMKFIHRHGKEFLVVEDLFCPNGHSLMVNTVRIHDEPSIRIEIDRPEGPGYVFIDAYWGSHAKLFTFLADRERPFEYVDAHCPECGASLVANRSCGSLECDSTQSLMFSLPGSGNAIYVCAKLGCPDHTIVVGDVPRDVQERVSEINFFGHGDEEVFGGI